MSLFPDLRLPTVPVIDAFSGTANIIDDEGNTTVLVVEDSAETLALLAFVLKNAGYKVIPARDGLDALYEFERHRPDLVVLDLELPTISGFRLMRLFRSGQQPASVPVIVVTGYDYEEVEEAVQAGAADLVTKPFEVADFLGRVDLVLSRARQNVCPPI